jgi:single-stranded DNA-binding protein
MDINKVHLIGTIVDIQADVDKIVTYLTVETSVNVVKKTGICRVYKNKHKVIAFGSIAMGIRQTARVGDKVLIDGRIESKKFDDGGDGSVSCVVVDRYQLS